MQNQFNIEEIHNGLRLDKAISLINPRISRTLVQKIIKNSQLKLNGKICDNISEKVKTGDFIEISETSPIPNDDNIDKKIEANPNIKIDVLYEDEFLLVINKQAGLTIHPGAGNHKDTLVNALLHRYKNNLSMVNGKARAGIVHRLDRDTTGVLLLAKDDFTHRELANQIKERTAKRIYHALVWNKPKMIAGNLQTNIGRHPADRRKRAVFKTSGKVAITKYKLLNSFFDGAISLLEVTLETGRTHQIRVHMEHLGMPVVGDKVYSGNQNQKKIGSIPAKILEKFEKLNRQFLHAYEISFTHPETLENLTFQAPYPKDIKAILSSVDGR
ncbi:MAG: RluA family pseudouridine synthase [Rickettsiales bacterium]|nr:RluA family pseudouridine synthase [Rickettsiales bacterium]